MTSKKIRIYPNKEQKLLFTKCFGAHRYFYNKSIEYVETNQYPKKVSHINIRNEIMPKKINQDISNSWYNEIPYDTRALAIKQFTENYSTAQTLKKKGFIKNFTFNKEIKKNQRQIFMINKKAISDWKIFPRRLKKKSKISFRKRMKKWIKKYISGINHNFIIMRENNRYYMLIPEKKTKTNAGQSFDDFVALDPGMRSFQTYFSQKDSGSFGKDILQKINKFNKRVDNLASLRQNHKIRRRSSLLRTKIRNVVDDFQWKLANWFVRRYKVVFIPKFSTKSIVQKSKNKCMNRALMNLSHFKFRQKLIHKANCFNDRDVIICNEAYTSKTCTICGTLNDVGASKVYNCNKCKLIIDRDLNGARNIFIKCLSKIIG